MKRDQESLISYPAINSKIRALPSTEGAGIGFGGASLIILDENDHHPYASENYVEIKPAIDAGGARQLIIVSATNRREPNSNFKKLYREARLGENNFHPIFLPYSCIPEHTETWYAETARDFEPWDMETRNPRTEEEALSTTTALCYFDEATLDVIKKEECFNAIETRRNGMIKIFKQPGVGKRYCMAFDPTGGGDPFAGGIMDWQTCELVATTHGKADLDTQAQIIIELYELYNHPYLGIERNPQGGGVNLIEKLTNAKITNLYKEKDKVGWYTGTQNRPTMLQAWREALYKRWVKIYDKNVIDEHFNFIEEPGKQPRATKGSNDDYVLMLSILWQIRKVMPMPAGEVKSYPYRWGS